MFIFQTSVTKGRVHKLAYIIFNNYVVILFVFVSMNIIFHSWKYCI